MTNVTISIFLLLLICCADGRPYGMENFDKADIFSTETSPLMRTIDSMSANFATALRTASPSMVTSMTMGMLAYVAYVASVMFSPSTLEKNGIPVLTDFSFEESRTLRSESGLLDNIIVNFAKDWIGKTEAADVMKNTSVTAVKQSMASLKRVTKMLNIGLSSLQGIVKKTMVALRPECLSKFMCRVGQFADYQMPILRPIFRNLRNYSLDEYSQALVTGTYGDCSSLFNKCEL